MRHYAMKSLSALTAGIIASVCLAAPSEAQRVRGEPAPLESAVSPIDTQVEITATGAVVTFGDRRYQLRNLPDAGGQAPGARVALEGDGVWRDINGRGWRSGRFSRYYGGSGPHELWLLPGFGLLAVNNSVSRTTGEVTSYRNIIRGRDGAMQPPVPGQSSYANPFAVRVGVQDNGLIAERTLLITGSTQAYNTSGMGGAMTMSPLDATLSVAWLFDENGIIQQWSPVADLSGNSGFHSASTSGFHYHQVSDQGHVLFATPGADRTINVHVLAPDLRAQQTFSGVVRLKLRSEDPRRTQTTVSAIGGMVRENREQFLDAHTTVLLVPLSEREGWYGLLQPDGSITVPADGVGLRPISRTVSSGAPFPGTRAIDYEMATGFVIAYDTPRGPRYGWASSELTAHTGPIWRDVRLHDSARLAQETPVLTSQILLAQFEEGYWRAYVEPEVHIPTSTWTSPNTFTGYVPPGSTAEQAITFAENVLVHMVAEINRADRETFTRTLAFMQEQRRADAQERLRRSAERQAFWSAALGAAFTGMAQAQPPSGGRNIQPSSLGPDFQWQDGALIHVPSGRRVD